MIRRLPVSTLTSPLFPNTTLFRSDPVRQLRHRSAPQEHEHDRRHQDEGSRLRLHLPTETLVCRARRSQGDRDPSPADDLLHHRLVQPRSEEHTSELQSLMRISYAVFCLKTKQQPTTITPPQP